MVSEQQQLALHKRGIVDRQPGLEHLSNLGENRAEQGVRAFGSDACFPANAAAAHRNLAAGCLRRAPCAKRICSRMGR
jgi:hypothetical protein